MTKPRSFLITILFLSINTTYSQNVDVRLEASYFLEFANHSASYNEVVDLGLKIAFIKKPKLNAGFGAGYTYSILKPNEDSWSNVNFYHVSSFIEYLKREDSRFRPSIGLGYSQMKINSGGNYPRSTPVDLVDINLGLNYYFSESIYLKFQSDVLIPTKVDQYRSEIFLMKLGLGITL